MPRIAAAENAVGSTEAARLAGVHRSVVIAAIESGQLPAIVEQRAERKRILINRSDAEAWAAQQRAKPPRANAPRKYGTVTQAQFVAAVESLIDDGKIRSGAWLESAALVLCFGERITDAAAANGRTGGISRPIKMLRDAVDSLDHAEIEDVESRGLPTMTTLELSTYAAAHKEHRDRPSKMTHSDFMNWHRRNGHTLSTGARALGMSRRMYIKYIKGEVAAYDLRTALACAALDAGVKPLGQ